MPEFNILVVFSRNPWPHTDALNQLNRVRDFYRSKVKLNFIIRFEDFGAPVWDAMQPNEYRYINEDWQDATLTRYALKVSKQRGEAIHCAILALSDADWKGGKLWGKRGDETQGITQSYVLAPYGKNHPNSNELRSSFLYFNVCHELGHFLARALGCPDVLHNMLQWDTSPRPDFLDTLKVTGWFYTYRTAMLTARSWWRTFWKI